VLAPGRLGASTLDWTGLIAENCVTVAESGPADDLRRQLEEVRESRARVVSAADAERRRIERELHDGVQQELIALAVNLQLARELVGGDAAGTHIEAASRDVHDALEAVRKLAEGVYPSLLIDRGLAEALRSAARRGRVPMRVEAPDERYAPEVEAAVYFSCIDALAVVDSATGAAVHVWRDRSALSFELAVDGAGEAPDLSTVADRVGALAGTLSVTAEGGRLTLTGTIPVGG
jgi:signal transduction histidine kinase